MKKYKWYYYLMFFITFFCITFFSVFLGYSFYSNDSVQSNIKINFNYSMFDDFKAKEEIVKDKGLVYYTYQIFDENEKYNVLIASDEVLIEKFNIQFNLYRDYGQNNNLKINLVKKNNGNTYIRSGLKDNCMNLLSHTSYAGTFTTSKSLNTKSDIDIIIIDDKLGYDYLENTSFNPYMCAVIVDYENKDLLKDFSQSTGFTDNTNDYKTEYIMSYIYCILPFSFSMIFCIILLIYLTRKDDKEYFVRRTLGMTFISNFLSVFLNMLILSYIPTILGYIFAVMFAYIFFSIVPYYSFIITVSLLFLLLVILFSLIQATIINYKQLSSGGRL